MRNTIAEQLAHLGERIATRQQPRYFTSEEVQDIVWLTVLGVNAAAARQAHPRTLSQASGAEHPQSVDVPEVTKHAPMHRRHEPRAGKPAERLVESTNMVHVDLAMFALDPVGVVRGALETVPGCRPVLRFDRGQGGEMVLALEVCVSTTEVPFVRMRVDRATGTFQKGFWDHTTWIFADDVISASRDLPSNSRQEHLVRHLRSVVLRALSDAYAHTDNVRALENAPKGFLGGVAKKNEFRNRGRKGGNSEHAVRRA